MYSSAPFLKAPYAKQMKGSILKPVRLFGVISLVVFTAASVGFAQEFEQNTNRVGMDIRDFNLERPEPGLCREACERDGACRSFTYLKPYGWQGAGPQAHCWIKSGIPPAKADNCCISGVIRRGEEGGAPRVTSVEPREGPALGGVRITIRGDHFSGANRVTFGGNEARGLEVISDDEVSVVLPPFPNPEAISPSGYQVDAAICTRFGCSPQYVPGNFTYRRVDEHFHFEFDVNRFGHDMKDFDLAEPEPRLCYDACVRDQECKSFTYLKPYGWQGAGPKAHCWLKWGEPEPKQDKCCVSGVLQDRK